MSGRIDIVSIFPEFFDSLQLSLLGKAQENEQLTIQAHNLRDWALDRHHKVDDTPYGGGAGMVMKPDVWGEAIDAVAKQAAPILLIPTPAGKVFDQAQARQLAQRVATGAQLIIACGRYEGIDARVGQHYESAGFEVVEFSIGDYVLNGGEVAAVVLVEAVGRLVPGVIGNPDSLLEESHESALLEYPSYTTPPTWRGLEVPAVLRSGHHGHVESWRRTQAVVRTAQRRRDLLAQHDIEIRKARSSDAAAVAEVAALTFPLACPPDFPAEAAEEFVANNLTTAHFRGYIKSRTRKVFVATIAGAVVGYTMVVTERSDNPDVLAALNGKSVWELSKFYVRPEFHGTQVAHHLMAGTVEWVQSRGKKLLWLGVNQRNVKAQTFYHKHGFTQKGTREFKVGHRTEADFILVRNLAEVPQLPANLSLHTPESL